MLGLDDRIQARGAHLGMLGQRDSLPSIGKAEPDQHMHERARTRESRQHPAHKQQWQRQQEQQPVETVKPLDDVHAYPLRAVIRCRAF